MKIGPISINGFKPRNIAWGWPFLQIGGLSLFQRDSGGRLMLASYHPRGCPTWHWTVTLGLRSGKGQWISRPPKEFRRGQWTTYVWLPFGSGLTVSRQDYHRDAELIRRWRNLQGGRL